MKMQMGGKTCNTIDDYTRNHFTSYKILPNSWLSTCSQARSHSGTKLETHGNNEASFAPVITGSSLHWLVLWCETSTTVASSHSKWKTIWLIPVPTWRLVLGSKLGFVTAGSSIGAKHAKGYHIA